MISFHHPLDYVGPHGEAVPCLHYYNPKSALLILNKEERERPLVQTQFAKATERFTYLGVKITPEIDNIVSARHDPLVKGIEDILERWSSLPISMIRRINIIKMSMLPKFLYLFQSIPLPLSAPFFNRLRRIITNFILNNKRARLHLSLIYLPVDRGGLRLPNMKLYYWAAQLPYSISWTAMFQSGWKWWIVQQNFHCVLIFIQHKGKHSWSKHVTLFKEHHISLAWGPHLFEWKR